MDYHNEWDPYCAQWIRNLMDAELIPRGHVDERDIRDVRPSDLAGYDRCHFFSGIAGWARALRLAGVRDDRPGIWTGSCPCQPFSSAGKRLGFADDRHLWPHWRGLIAERRPPVVFGEQVARASDWLALVRSDLEGMAYAVGAIPVEAASIGARHLRNRYWFVAHALGDELRNKPGRRGWTNGESAPVARDDGATRYVADADGTRQPQSAGQPGPTERRQCFADPNSMANTNGEPPLGSPVSRTERDPWLAEPNVGRVAARLPQHVDQLRALGNSIVPQAAAAFIRAALS